MKKAAFRLSILSLILVSILSRSDAHAFEAIRNVYQERLNQADEGLARNPAQEDKAALLQKKAQALDTLGHHAQALDAINESLAIKPTIQASLTKSIILRASGLIILVVEYHPQRHPC